MVLACVPPEQADAAVLAKFTSGIHSECHRGFVEPARRIVVIFDLHTIVGVDALRPGMPSVSVPKY